MLEIPRDTNQTGIDIAYRQATARLSRGTLRGATEAIIEARLIHDGYQILSNAELRARYDAKLLAAETEVKITLFPRRRVRQAQAGHRHRRTDGVVVDTRYHHISQSVDQDGRSPRRTRAGDCEA
jgi:DnaJ-class molecular chaperone